MYLFTLQLHATLNAPQEHGDHPAINWSLLPGQEKARDSYWVESSAAWFPNGPGGHLVTWAVEPGWRLQLPMGPTCSWEREIRIGDKPEPNFTVASLTRPSMSWALPGLFSLAPPKDLVILQYFIFGASGF